MAATWLAPHRYLLAPATAAARVRRERTEQPLRSRTRPRLAAHLTLDTVALDLTQVKKTSDNTFIHNHKKNTQKHTNAPFCVVSQK